MNVWHRTRISPTRVPVPLCQSLSVCLSACHVSQQDQGIQTVLPLQNILRSQTAAGMRHRDHGTTGSVIHKNIRPALTTYFFGLDGEKKLTVDKFSRFQEQLQVAMTCLHVMNFIDD